MSDKKGDDSGVLWKMHLNDDKQSVAIDILVDDKQSVAIDILVDDKLAVRHNADAYELDDLIRTLGKGRASLLDAVPTELEPKVRMRTIRDPHIRAGRRSDGSYMMSVRDPAYGWTLFLLGEEDAEALVQALRPAGKK